MALDLSGRPFLAYDIEFPPDTIALGTPPFDPQLAEEFWRAFATVGRADPPRPAAHGQEHPPHRRGVLQGGGPGPAGRGAPRGRRHPLDQGDPVISRADPIGSEPAGLGRPVIAVLDYGIGNLRSAEKALQHLGADAASGRRPGPGRGGRRRGAPRGGRLRALCPGPAVERAGPGGPVGHRARGAVPRHLRGVPAALRGIGRGSRRARARASCPARCGGCPRGQASPRCSGTSSKPTAGARSGLLAGAARSGLGLLRALLRPRADRRHLGHLRLRRSGHRLGRAGPGVGNPVPPGEVRGRRPRHPGQLRASRGPTADRA